MDVLETILSVLVGILGTVVAAAAFLASVLWLILRYLVTMLISLAVPKLRCAARLDWLLADAEKNDPKLRTGLISRVKMQGAGSDALFRGMRESIRQYRTQKWRRRSISDRTVLSGIFAKYDSVYLALIKQFWTAADSIDWSKTDVYNWDSNSAFPVMRKAADSLQMLIAEHEKTLTHALHQDVQDAVSEESIAQDMEFLQSFNASQNELSASSALPEQPAEGDEPNQSAEGDNPNQTQQMQ